MGALQAEWEFARSLTETLLAQCDPDDLRAEPIAGLAPLWKLFRHIGRVHANYLEAVGTGAVSFTPHTGGFSGPVSRAALLAYFQELAEKHRAVFEAAPGDQVIDWGDERVDLSTHLTRLISHESLHHGQLILIWRQLGHPFPPEWAAWGET